MPVVWAVRTHPTAQSIRPEAATSGRADHSARDNPVQAASVPLQRRTKVNGPIVVGTDGSESATAAVEAALPDVERCVERVATRLGHGFTDEDATRKMHSEFARADIDQGHLIVDPPDQ
jgi:hypothetical protein